MEIHNHYVWLWNLMDDTTKDSGLLAAKDYSQRREIADARAVFSKIRRLRQESQEQSHP
jgi:hypothetical protein